VNRPRRAPAADGSILRGFFLVIGLHLFQVALWMIGQSSVDRLGTAQGLNLLMIRSVFAIALTQLVYVVPAAMWAAQRQRWGIVKGIWIAAGLTAVLNGTCWIVVAPLFGLKPSL
jgi:hypothetical protein